MEFLAGFADIVLHFDEHLKTLVEDYAIVFAIIFLEAGVAISLFVPGEFWRHRRRAE